MVDPHLERIKNAAVDDESDEEDEDSVAEKDDGGSPTDDSDASESGDGKEKPTKKEARQDPSVSKASSTSKRKSRDGDENDAKKRKKKKSKQKKKKDPNAPKKPKSVFMFFSQMERENIRKDNPGISFRKVGKVIGERWKKMTAEEKEPYVAKAQADKKRYKEAMADYKNATNIVSGNECDSE